MLAGVALSHNKGVTWSTPKDVGAPFGIHTAVFPAVVAGDPDRAAAFLGTATAGNATGTDVNFPGAWHLILQPPTMAERPGRR